MGSSIGLGLSGLGLGLNLYGQYQQGQIQAQQGQWAQRQAYLQAAIMDYNAALGQAEAPRLEAIGRLNQSVYLADAAAARYNAADQAHKLRRAASQVSGQQISTYLKNGVSLEGTPALVIMEDQAVAEKDIANTLEAGNREAAKLELAGGLALLEGLQASRKALTQAALDAITARETRAAGQYALQAGQTSQTAAYVGMGASLLQGAGGLYMRYQSPAATTGTKTP